MAYGLQPAYHLTGGTVRLSEYEIADDYSTNIFSGDPVVLVSDGTIEVATPGSNTNNIGVFYGVSYTAENGEVVFKRYWDQPSNATNIKAHVYDDPNIVFKVQSDQDSSALSSADIGGNIDATSGTGDTSWGTSGWYLDSSGGTGSSAAQLRVIGSAETDKEWTSAGTAMDVYVRFNEHSFLSTTGV